MTRDEKKFWTLLFLLNFLLFLPNYILNIYQSAFLPFSLWMKDTWSERFELLLFARSNYDIFRINVDLFALVLVFWLFRKKINTVKYGVVAGVYYTILLVFLLYFDIMFKIYLIDPLLYNDVSLLKLGFLNANGSILLKFLVLLIVFAIVLLLIVKVMIVLIKITQKITFSVYGKVFLGVLGFFFAINTVRSGTTFEAKHEFQLTTGLIADNVIRSFDARNNLRHLDVEKLIKVTGYDDHKLREKPDIYLLFFESYGKVLYENSMFRDEYIGCIQKCDAELSKQGWHSASCLSESPISGGRSWISFSSVIYGFNIRNQGSYLHLFSNQDLPKYPNMIRYFKNQGYHSYWVNPIAENKDLQIPWDLYSKFYAVDTWIQFKDMGYEGKLQGFGPFPPDQYPLNFAEDVLIKNASQPHFLFYITHNSHYPFDSPDTIASDWHVLSTGYHYGKQSPTLIKKHAPENYIKSVKYDLKVLGQFILRKRDRKTIFIIIGDHQPPLLATKKNGFETPVHIICKDSIFVNSFKTYGFNRGLKINDLNKSIRHEAIYSMVLREVLRRFGEGYDSLPEYLERGVDLQKL